MSFLSRFRPVFHVLFYLKTAKFEMRNFFAYSQALEKSAFARYAQKFRRFTGGVLHGIIFVVDYGAAFQMSVWHFPFLSVEGNKGGQDTPP